MGNIGWTTYIISTHTNKSIDMHVYYHNRAANLESHPHYSNMDHVIEPYASTYFCQNLSYSRLFPLQYHVKDTNNNVHEQSFSNVRITQ